MKVWYSREVKLFLEEKGEDMEGNVDERKIGKKEGMKGDLYPCRMDELDDIEERVEDRVEDQVEDQVEEQVEDQIEEQVEEQVAERHVEVGETRARPLRARRGPAFCFRLRKGVM